MAGKLTALGSNFYFGTADLSGDVGLITNADTSRAALVVTALNQSAEERKVGRRDGALDFMAFWNVDASRSHPVLSALPRTNVIETCVVGTPAIGSPAASMTCKQANFASEVGDDGSMGITIATLANGYGLEWSGGANGDGMLTAGKQTFGTGTVNGTSVNLGSTDSAFGAAAYLHVFSHGSGTATFKIQDSDDNVTFADVTDLAFTAVTGATSQRLQTAAGATIRQYVRVQKTGVSTATVAAINFIRYTEAGPV